MHPLTMHLVLIALCGIRLASSGPVSLTSRPPPPSPEGVIRASTEPVVLHGSSRGPPPPKPTSAPPKLDRPNPDVDAFKDTCKSLLGNCKDPSEKAKKNKDAVRDLLSRTRGNGKVKGKSKEEIDTYLDAVLQAKKAVLASKNLRDVVTPHDNGLWAGDQLPSLDMLQRIITDSANVTLLRTKRATGISLDYYSGNKWPSTTVNYYIDPYTFSTQEADLIRSAIKTLQSGTCLSFAETLQTPYIEFLKTPYGTSANTCGWANLGYTGPVNDAVVNFDSALCKSNLQGTIIHEILHVLGISHEHNRYDRDSYVDMDWNNVDPQSYDVYSHDDAYDYNPYCVGYDYLSVMHYSPYVAVLDPSKPAFQAKVSPEYYLPRMGTVNTPSDQDLSLVNRLYCSPSSCLDTTPYCGWTACADCSTYASACPKSCGQC